MFLHLISILHYNIGSKDNIEHYTHFAVVTVNLRTPANISFYNIGALRSCRHHIQLIVHVPEK